MIGNATALDDGIVLMVKAIATSSAKIVAAGRIKFSKTSEIQQLLNRGISSNATVSTTNASGEGTSYQDANAIAKKDIGSLRVVLKSVLPMKLTGRNGQSRSGIRCTFEFVNRETQRPLVVAANAEAGRQKGIFTTGSASIMGTALGDVLRTTLVDERGTVWALPSSGLTGMGIVSPGWDENMHAINPTEIVSLLQRQGDTGKSTNPRNGRAFIFGSMTPVPPGQSVAVVMNFVQDAGETTSGKQPTYFQVNSEIVIGVETTDRTKVYSLHNLMFDRVSMPGRR